MGLSPITRIRVYDAVSGAMVKECGSSDEEFVHLLPLVSFFSGPGRSANGRFLIFVERGEVVWFQRIARALLLDHFFTVPTPDRITVFDQETRSVVLSQIMSCSPVEISNDGKSLLTSRSSHNHKNTIECWDIPFARRWTWIIGPPASLAALAIGWRLWRGRKESP